MIMSKCIYFMKPLNLKRPVPEVGLDLKHNTNLYKMVVRGEGLPISSVCLIKDNDFYKVFENKDLG
jgi:hypothetical protein